MGDVAFVYLCVGVIAIFIAYQIWWHSNYKFEESDILKDTGVIEDLDLDIEVTDIPIGNQFFHPHDVSKDYNVTIRGNTVGTFTRNNKHLFKHVKEGDIVEIEYKEIYQVRKDNPNIKINTKIKRISVIANGEIYNEN